ncbi:ATP-binding protein [Celeribacter sp.]|uniref:sensor histidine kinase n=1 Tax=Celeribacter sp. TaxID=1890673 RepID=UPI003A938118
MMRLWNRVAPKIWTRLFLMVTAAIVLTWIVVAASFYWLNNARLVVTDLSTVHAPRLAQTSRLSATTADLAMLSNRILSEGGETPDDLETMLKTSVTDLNTLIDDGFGTVLTQQDSQALQRHLALVIRSLDQARQIEAQLRNHIEQLRWLNVDVQDEAAAVMADFSYNIEVLTRELVREPDPALRKKMADMLSGGLNLQALFSSIGNDTATATTLAIQISTSQSLKQLEQLENLVADALAQVNARIDELPVKAEYQFMRQTSGVLAAMTTQPGGLVERRKAWHQTRQLFRDELETALNLLKNMQNRLLHQSQAQRIEMTALSEGFSKNAAITLKVLLALTVLAAAGGGAILFYYIRPSIIRPMARLTTAMRQIAGGERADLKDIPVRNDEIAQLVEAVNAFQNSVRERDQAIQDLRQMQSELVQVGKMAALGNLSAGISHELNQPLGAIRQRLRLAQKAADKGDAARLRTQTDKIDGLVTRMERIILHLRRFARRSEYQRENVALTRAFRGAQELLNTQIVGHRITVRIDPALEEARVIGDVILVEQVLVNLLSNACDAIAAIGQGGDILIRKEPCQAGEVTFSIVDTGIGLGDLDPERAFDPFVTTKDPGAGLGLGLSISFNIITGMNGTLTLSPRADTGTRATVTLPAGTPDND